VLKELVEMAHSSLTQINSLCDQPLIQTVAARYARYLASPVSAEIASCDDMFTGQMDHYFAVGRSAIDIIAEMMIRTQRAGFLTVLDLPCGGGRVTRHLQSFLPEARLFVSDLDKQKESFVTKTFGVTAIAAAPAFDRPLDRSFDLIFAGSLVTHLGVEHFHRCMHWLAAAVASNGLLIITTSGRRNSANFAAHYASPEFEPMHAEFLRSGFGFCQMWEVGHEKIPYGGSLILPARLMSIAEQIEDVHIVGFSEGAWDHNQDVLVLQKA
jgi:SAM-dependent methyltransferase